jgi:beta-lactamase class A
MQQAGFMIRTAALMLAALVPACNAIPDAQAPVQMPPRASATPLSIPVPSTVLPERPRARAPQALEAQVAQLMREFPGKAGAAIRAVDEGWTIERGGMLSLPQQSVSKLWVALTVLDQRDAGKLSLDEPIVVGPGDLTLFHQPIASLATKPGGFRTTVGGLLFRALTQSDNTANDKLLWRVGGPAAVRAFIAKKQLGAIRFGPGERLLQAGTAGLTWNQSMALGRGFEAARTRLPEAVRQAAFDRYTADPVDGAAPLAIADALARLARGELLSETSTRTLLDTMASSITGRARLRAGLAPGWQIAHKTGTGQEFRGRNAGFNDVGLLTAPDGRRYAVAVMIGDTRAPMRVRQALIAGVAAALTGGRTAGVGSDGEE